MSSSTMPKLPYFCIYIAHAVHYPYQAERKKERMKGRCAY